MRFPKATPSLLCGATAVSLILLPNPDFLPHDRAAQAHQVEIVEDIGATLHIEPNDTPRAGEEVLAWFALTRRGGETIPLAACDCQLTVHTQPKDEAASLTPTLSAVDAEGYKDIPGARFTFPAVGAYTLSISGSPNQAEDFTPFELDFDVTVAAGQSAPATTAESTEGSLEQATSTTTSSLSVDSPEAQSEALKESSEGLSRRLFTFVFIGLSLAMVIGVGITKTKTERKNKQKP